MDFAFWLLNYGILKINHAEEIKRLRNWRKLYKGEREREDKTQWKNSILISRLHVRGLIIIIDNGMLSMRHMDVYECFPNEALLGGG